MSAQARKKLRSQISPDYKYQTMAITYHRPVPAADANRRSTRVPIPIEAAREAIHNPRKVRVKPAAAPVHRPVHQESDDGEDDVADAPHLPQSFRQALPTSSLEPGTTNLEIPPSHTFPDQPVVGGDPVLGQNALQIAARLQTSLDDNQQLLAKLKAAIWERTVTEEPSSKEELLIPAVPHGELFRTHAAAVLLDNSNGVLDVNNCIPQQVIIDTGAVCVMMSKRYAKAVGVNLSTLKRGIEFITADGALASSLGTTPQPLEFVLARNTPHEHKLLVHASIIDTPAYDILLGMEFIRAAKGLYDAYTERFTYRYLDQKNNLLSHSLSAPCHTLTPPVVAAAFMAGLIDAAADLLDVQGTSDNRIPEEEEEESEEGEEKEEEEDEKEKQTQNEVAADQRRV